MSTLIEASEVTFIYPQDGYGLRPVSLNVAAGQVWLVKGASGYL